jgi:peptide-methionine (R)-S-oxide reductase
MKLKTLLLVALVGSIHLLSAQMHEEIVVDENFSPKVKKSEMQWKKELSSTQYRVLRQAGTEYAFTSDLLDNKEEGTYHCAACDAPLFKSEYKYDSGSGWPSFDRPIKGAIAYDVDYNIGVQRIEEKCANCGSHLGHVFNDGPTRTTGKRHCINGVALTFVPNGK